MRRLRQLVQKRSARWAEGAFVVEGAEVLRSALAADAAVESVYLSPAGVADGAIRAACEQAEKAGARLFPLAEGVLERVADTVTPQPVMAIVPMLAAPDTVPVADPGALVAVMVDVRDPGNAGTILRTADASGVCAVLFSADSVDPYNPKAVRASAGSVFHVPFGVRPDALAALDEVNQAGYTTLGTVAGSGQDHVTVDWTRPSALFFGNESAGLDARVLERVDATVSVMMDGRAESLNVAVACAVICFEALRQRRAGGLAPRSGGGNG
ncbi:MAG TPA: RNA methyltransferase [Acidimicrobiales bacterium]|nr:RNA methyltransferase [Acidimicrobiales bacterium]